jgi:hypothetical protein
MAFQKQAMVDIVAALIRNGPILLILKAIAVTAGLAIVISHNVSSDACRLS